MVTPKFSASFKPKIKIFVIHNFGVIQKITQPQM